MKAAVAASTSSMSEINFIISGTFTDSLNVAYQGSGQEQLNFYNDGVAVLSAVTITISTVQGVNLTGLTWNNNDNPIPTLAIQSVSQVTLDNLQFGNNVGNQIRIVSSTNVIMNGITMTSNKNDNGSPVQISAQSITIMNSEFDGNSGTTGSVFQINNGQTTITHSQFMNNDGGSTGPGAIFLSISDTAKLSIYNCGFSRNTAWVGAGVSISGTGTVAFDTSGTVWNSNNVVASGGAIFINSNGLANVQNSTFSFNNASDGGSIQFAGVTAVIMNCIVTYNTAVARGGGLRFDIPASLTFTNNTVSSNRAGTEGGGLWLASNTAYQVINKRDTLFSRIRFSIFFNNTANRGGGIMIYGQNSVVSSFAEDCAFSYNFAVTGGGISLIGSGVFYM